MIFKIEMATGENKPTRIKIEKTGEVIFD